MRASSICCGLGAGLALAIAALHTSGFDQFTGQFAATNASQFLKDMFPVLYLMPSLYLVVLAVFGVLAIALKHARRPICLVLAPAMLAAGALALLLGEWLPLVVMGLGGVLFLLAALLSPNGEA